MIHIPGGTEGDRARFYHGTQNSAQCKTYELFISEIFHLIFSDLSWPQGTETAESKTMDKGGTTVFNYIPHNYTHTCVGVFAHAQNLSRSTYKKEWLPPRKGHEGLRDSNVGEIFILCLLFPYNLYWDFPGGAVVKNPPANTGDTGSSPGAGRSHMPRSN